MPIWAATQRRFEAATFDERGDRTESATRTCNGLGAGRPLSGPERASTVFAAGGSVSCRLPLDQTVSKVRQSLGFAGFSAGLFNSEILSDTARTPTGHHPGTPGQGVFQSAADPVGLRIRDRRARPRHIDRSRQWSFGRADRHRERLRHRRARKVDAAQRPMY